MQDDSNKQLAFISPYVGKVGCPFLISACRFKLPVQQIRRDGVNWRIELPWCPASLVTRFDTDGFHPSCHQVLAAGEINLDKGSHYARRAICAIAGLVAVLVRVKKLGILSFMRTY